MDELEIIRQLREQNELLRLENEMLKARISELEARLANMNAHTPPNLRRGRNLKKDKNNQGKSGQKVGHRV
jgi:BMFP domain-containing protein YqiC